MEAVRRSRTRNKPYKYLDTESEESSYYSQTKPNDAQKWGAEHILQSSPTALGLLQHRAPTASGLLHHQSFLKQLFL